MYIYVYVYVIYDDVDDINGNKVLYVKTRLNLCDFIIRLLNLSCFLYFNIYIPVIYYLFPIYTHHFDWPSR